MLGDDGLQGGSVNWFGDERVTAGGKAFFSYAGCTQRGKGDDGNVGILFDNGGCFVAVHLGHEYVHEYQVKTLAVELINRVAAVGGDGGFESHAVEQNLDKSLTGGVVFGDEDMA